MIFYQTLHFFSGFISSSFWQLKAVAKSSELAKVPKTLKENHNNPRIQAIDKAVVPVFTRCVDSRLQFRSESFRPCCAAPDLSKVEKKQLVRVNFLQLWQGFLWPVLLFPLGVRPEGLLYPAIVCNILSLGVQTIQVHTNLPNFEVTVLI